MIKKSELNTLKIIQVIRSLQKNLPHGELNPGLPGESRLS